MPLGSLSPLPDDRGMDEPRTLFGKGLDVLMRPTFFLAKLADEFINEPGVTFGKALSESWRELVSPEDRLTFEDVIERAAPTFAETNPIATSVLGFAADVALDPVNLVGLGAATKVTRVPRLVAMTSEEALDALKVVDRGGDVADGVKVLKDRLPSLPGWLKGPNKEEFLGGTKTSIEAAADSLGFTLDAPAVREALSATPLDEVAKPFKAQVQKFRERWGEISDLERLPGWIDPESGRIFATRGEYIVRKGAAKEQLSDPLMTLMSKIRKGGDKSSGLSGQNLLRLNESYTRRISRLALDPEIGKEVVEELPVVRIAGKTLVSRAPLRKVAESLGIPSLLDEIKTIPAIRALRAAFIGKADYPKELIQDERLLASEVRRANEEGLEITGRLFQETDEAGRERIARAMSVSNDTAEAERRAGALTKRRQAEIIRDSMDSAGLTADERSLVGKLSTVYANLAEIEGAAGLLKHASANYNPRLWTMVREGGRESFRNVLFTRRTAQRDEMAELFFGPEQARVFQSIKQGENFVDPITGERYKPVMDAAVLLAQRVSTSKRALANQMFKDRITKMFPGVRVGTSGKIEGVENIGAMMALYGVKSQKRMMQIVQSINDRATFLREGLYSRASSPVIQSMVRGYDKLLNAFRISATVLKPNFGPRQLIANTGQIGLGLGKHFDPIASVPSTMMLTGRADDVGRVASAIGEPMDGASLWAEASALGIPRDITVEGIGRGTSVPRTPREMTKLLNERGNVHGKRGVAAGMRALFERGVGQYMDFPGHMEDFGRTWAYVSARKLGHTPAQAADLVDQQLFDYLNGLSEFETRFMRRIIPFYTFQKFAVGMIGKVAAQSPVRITNLARTTETIMDAYGKSLSGGRELTPEERSVVPEWLMFDQVGDFVGWNKAMEAEFKGITNVTPVEIFAATQLDKEGGIDVRETLLHAGLAQMTPMLKIPLELAVQKDFFTGRAIDPARTGKQINPATFLSVLSGLATATGLKLGQQGMFGRIGKGLSSFVQPGVGGLAAAGGAFGMEAIRPGTMEELLGNSIGLERGVNRRGEPMTYFSPYRFHVMRNALPGMNEAVKVAHRKSSPTEGAMSLIFGMNQYSLDLPRQAQRLVQEDKREIAKLKGEAKRSLLEQRMDDYKDAVQELQAFTLAARERWEEFEFGNVRGPSNPPTGLEPQGVQ